ncbi:acyl-CoA dehydrogenase C-terminal domain-containing protein [Halorhodospira halochloris]|uniref:acyl-CoA dehydrogenase C-terminal domain-containing protein n=1 Tax=Halorhodospira halochloris TaxID=1052 RepID=UPI001EE934AE|nr:acyl-CoA dehydrogenase C-terminal domain-containing protein [Halorhodospira halochloris]MCG5547938.1 acyl-CoA dehydrogenase C-terminal domain-containing protein [Halorhodospira halochloris]
MSIYYKAPVRDLCFVIEELIGLQHYAGMEGVEELDAELVSAILEEAGRLASEEWAPLNSSGDRQGCALENGQVKLPDGFIEAYKSFTEAGWNGINAPVEHGGQGLPEVIASATQEIWHGANMALALAPMLSAGATELLAQHGDAELQQRYLDKLVSGEWTGTMDLSEPQAGSDLGQVAARALPDETGDSYRLFGQKIFITWGDHQAAENIIHLVLARTPDAPAGHRGISLFLVPKFLVNADGSLGERNAVFCDSLEHKVGIHASPTCTIRYGDNQGNGAVGYLVGELNRGLNHMFTMMNEARHKVGVQGIGIGERVYQGALAFARERVQGRRPGGKDSVPILGHPDVRRMLMTIRAQTEAMRALALVSAAYQDKALHASDSEERAAAQRRVDLFTPVVKAVASDWAVDSASLGIQVHGGMGFVEELEAAQLWRDVRIAPIYEGTNGIQAQDFTLRKVLKDSGETLEAVLGEIEQVVAELRADSVVSDLGARLKEGVGTVRESTRYLLENQEDPFVSLSAATPYMMQAGCLFGAWQLGRAALVARAVIERGGDGDGFYSAKLHTARFYMRHILPRVHAYTPAVCGGSDELEAIEERHW